MQFSIKCAKPKSFKYHGSWVSMQAKSNLSKPTLVMQVNLGLLKTGAKNARRFAKFRALLSKPNYINLSNLVGRLIYFGNVPEYCCFEL